MKKLFSGGRCLFGSLAAVMSATSAFPMTVFADNISSANFDMRDHDDYGFPEGSDQK